MNNHPLYNRVQKVVAAKAVNGSVTHDHFGSIRNQSSVRAILLGIGYKPNCEASPSVWDLNKKTAPVAKPVGIARKQVLKKLQTGNIVYFEDLGVSKNYATNLINKLRKGGWPIESIVEKHPSKGRPRAIGYRLINEVSNG